MLPAQQRLRLPGDFSHTLRSGVRVGRRNLVLYTAIIPSDAVSKCGFIVSKSVGNAVARNLVKRRLREACVSILKSHPQGVAVVIRALPASADASWEELVRDVDESFASAHGRALARINAPGIRPGKEQPSAREGEPRP